MSKHFENILEQVYQLSRSEQLALIESIAHMLNETEEFSIPASVQEENRRRLNNYDRGETKGIPFKDALNYVREKIKGS